ncbi:hypothetical protein FBEOM_14629, partial [Fusarium beomiforme]
GRNTEPSGPVRSLMEVVRKIPRDSTNSNPQEASDYDLDSDSDSESILDSGYGSADENPEQEPPFYNGFIDQRDNEGPAIANHDENTKRMTYPEKQKWNRFYETIKGDPLETFNAFKASIFKAYLHWRLKHSRIKKESSIMTCWNVLSYPCVLTPFFGPDTSKKEKSGLFVEDLALILNRHYVYDTKIYAHETLRVQLSPILLIVGATGTQPDAFIGSVLYKHVEFQLFLQSPGEKRPCFGLVVDLINIKKTAGSSRSIIYGFHEEDTLLHNPVRSYLIALGRALGYSKRLEFYDIRRGSGKKLNEELGPEGRKQATGHRLEDSSTYVRYYMTDFAGANIQAIVFGSDPQTDSIKLMSRLVRHGKAPMTLTDQQKDEIFNDPRIAKYRHERSKALAQPRKKGYKSVAAAKKADVSKRYEKYQNRIGSLRKTLMDRCLESVIVEFHQTIHGKEIDQQLNGIKPSKEVLTPSTINYDLEERAEVARLFAQAPHLVN